MKTNELLIYLEEEMKPIVSVIIPVYNAEIYLVDCINSVRQQTLENIQIILIDDCSTDHSLSLCYDFEKEDARILVIRNEHNKGVSASRNAGIHAAIGKYIVFVDSDDIIDRDMISYLVELIERSDDIDISACSYYIDNVPADNIIKKERIYEGVEIAKAMAAYKGCVIRGYSVNKLFDRKMILNNNIFFDEELSICEDALFCQQIALRCKKMYFGPEPKYHYLIHDGSACRSKISRKRLSVFSAYEKIINLCKVYEDKELDSVLQANFINHHLAILQDAVCGLSLDQVIYSDYVAKSLKTNFNRMWCNTNLSIKRKILAIVLLVRYRMEKIRLNWKKN